MVDPLPAAWSSAGSARRFTTDTLVLLALTLVIVSVVVGMAALGLASRLEAVGFITGAVCVWLTVKESVWNFPIGILNVATFSVVFFRAGLLADAGLQGVYLVLCVVGWYLWLHGGQRGAALRVSRASARELLVLAVIAAVLTLGLWRTLRYAGGSASFWDALTTAISLAAQWLLSRKRLDNWALWIIVDAIYVPLYLYKALYLTAALYAVFLAMAVVGLRQWTATWRGQFANAGRVPDPAVAAP